MEAAGLALGVVPLAFDLFDNAVRLFKFVGTLVDMPRDCENLRLQLLIEYNRVLAWGKAAGLVEVPDGSSLGVTLGTNATELCGIVARIGWLLAEFRELNARYGNELNPYARDGGKPEVTEARAAAVDVASQVSSLAVSYEKEKRQRRYRPGHGELRGFFVKAAHNTKEVVMHPGRVRWAEIDKEAFEALLRDLHVLTGRLRELMGDHRERAIDEITAKTYREMVLARNEIHDLRAMLAAVTCRIDASPSPSPSTATARDNDETLRDLLKLKEISQASEDILSGFADKAGGTEGGRDLASFMTVSRFTAAEFEARLAWTDGDDEDGPEPEAMARPRAVLESEEGGAGEVAVWVEWKNLGPTAPGSAQERESRLRTGALAEMLHKEKPRALCLPTAVGYADDLTVYGSRRHAWVFAMPGGADDSAGAIKSLHDILGDRRFRPTLSRRVALAGRLASTVLYLHTVNWLHKGIRSDNVIFHVGTEDDNSGFNAEEPVLSGFDYARPQSAGTTARAVDDQWSIYRWPGVQGDGHGHAAFRKTYDIYSLGLVLLEIAHWQPLSGLLNLRGWPKVSGRESRAVRGWLLGSDTQAVPPFEGPSPLEELRDVAGEKFYGAVRRCLAAHGEAGLGVDEAAEQSSDPAVGMQLQEAFSKLVVEELKSVQV